MKPLQSWDTKSSPLQDPLDKRATRDYIPKNQNLRPRYIHEKKSARINHPHARGKIRRHIRNWWAEFFAGIIVTVSFGGLVSVLRKYQDKPTPNWPLGLSFNTALAVFGVVFRAPVLFIAVEGIGQLKWQWFSKTPPLSNLSDYDNATRGPWGATKLLWIVRWRDILASLGAFIIVVSFGIDPFTQAFIRYNGCDIVNPLGDAYISLTNSYFSQRPGDDLETSARLAIDSGFSSPNAIVPDFGCSSSKCQFDCIYHSIGLCSNCVDVTSELHQTCRDYLREVCNYTLSRFPQNSRFDITAGYLNSSLVNDTSLTTWRVFSASKFATKQFPKNYSSILSNNGIVPDFQSSTVDFVSASPILGARCYLYYCVRSYNATIESNVLKENLQYTSSNWSTNTEQTPVLGTVRVDCLEPHVQEFLQSKGYITPQTDWMPWNGTFLNEGQKQVGLVEEGDAPILSGKCIYQIQVLDLFGNSSSEEFYTDFLAGSLSGSGADRNITLDPTSSGVLAGLYNDSQVTVDSLNQGFENFTSAVSNYMRWKYTLGIPRNISNYVPGNLSKANIPPNPVQSGLGAVINQPVSGVSIVRETCINVRWPWLTLPAFIFGATIVFLISLITRSLYFEQEVWESSQNELMWHGLSGPAEEEGVALASENKMDERAKEILVNLRKTKNGWKLAQVDE